MDVNPHSLHMILSRIREQMCCPQCGTPVSVDFPAVKMAQEEFMLLQLKCGSCGAFIVLHVNINEQGMMVNDASSPARLLNVSSTLTLSDGEMAMLRTALSESGGSFEKLFQDAGVKK